MLLRDNDVKTLAKELAREAVGCGHRERQQSEIDGAFLNEIQ